MNLLEELMSLFQELGIPAQTGEFSDITPDTYVLLTPISDDFDLYADNSPTVEVQSVRISLFTKGNYSQTVRKIVKALLSQEITISDKVFVGREVDTGYNHYAIDCENFYLLNEEGNTKG
jgi:hypothetical protein